MGKKSDHIARLGDAAEKLAEKGNPEAVQEARKVINKHLDDLEEDAKRKKG